MGNAHPKGTPVPVSPTTNSSPHAESKCPVSGKAAPPAVSSAESTSLCPMKYKNPNQYNVYSQKLDPSNQMPVVANQNPAPNQAVTLPTERVPSNIPKGGTDGTWVYPSPQMVVAVHNNMNENTWAQVLCWEALHRVTDPGREPKLLKFIGKPDDLSNKARLKVLFGHPKPFDRHDWTVDRGGTEVRYVIDYYHDESAVSQDQKPRHLTDAASMKSIVVDVRPALDSPQALLDRLVWMPWLQMTGKTAYNPPPFFPKSEMQLAEEAKAASLRAKWAAIQDKCAGAKDRVKACDSDESCSQAAMALQRCTASVVCPSVVASFDECLRAQLLDDSKLEGLYNEMGKCIEIFKLDSATILTTRK